MVARDDFGYLRQVPDSQFGEEPYLGLGQAWSPSPYSPYPYPSYQVQPPGYAPPQAYQAQPQPFRLPWLLNRPWRRCDPPVGWVTPALPYTGPGPRRLYMRCSVWPGPAGLVPEAPGQWPGLPGMPAPGAPGFPGFPGAAPGVPGGGFRRFRRRHRRRR
jgi:hypothetical protein